MPAKRLTANDVKISIKALDEDTDPRSSYAVPGIISPDSEDADRFVEAVEEMVDKHGLWGWCMVEVTARLANTKGTAHLGGCSYEDEEDFKKGGYYEQMVEEAIAELQQQIDEIYELIHVKE